MNDIRIPSLLRSAMAGVLLLALFTLAGPARAEMVLSFYLGGNASPDSTVDYDFARGDGAKSANVSWDGETFKFPPYFGLRAIWWFEDHPNWGVGIDNVHAKLAADPMPEEFTTLEFTDGVNMITGNVHYRFLNGTRFSPYIGAGVGITTPHVEATNTDGSSETFWYQFGGFSAQALVGLEARINDRWSVFGELKTAMFWIDVDLQYDGWLETDIRSNQIAFGVNYTLSRW